MLLQRFYRAAEIPDSALLGKRIFKKTIYENAQLSAADAKALKEDVSAITWQYSLKPNSVQIHSFEDEVREYLEVAVLEVSLRSRKRSDRIANLLHRSIPYPLVLVLTESDGLLLSVAHKRFSLAEKGTIVAEKPIGTNWLSEPINERDELFLNSLRHSGLSHQNFYSYYEDFGKRVLAHNCSEISGAFRFEGTDEERRTALEEYEEMAQEIAKLKSKVKKATQFAEKVELNIAIKDLERRLTDAVARL